MSPIGLILGLGALWSLLHFWLEPLLRDQWAAVGLQQKIGRAGSLAVIEKLGSLAGIGAAAVAATVVFVQATSLIGGLPLPWPKMALGAANSLFEWTTAVSETYGTVITALGLVGAGLVLWSAAKVAKQRVVEAWSAKAQSAYTALFEDPEILEAARHDPALAPLAEGIDGALAGIERVQAAAPPSEADLARAHETLRDAVSALAIALAARDTDVMEVAARPGEDADAAPPATTPWRRFLAVLSSPKLSQDLGLLRKPMSRTVTALLFVSLIGWASEPLADSLRLTVNNMRVQVDRREAKHSLDEALSHLPPAPPAAKDEDDAPANPAVVRASQLVARGVVREMARSSLISGSARATEAGYDRAELVRAALTGETVDPAAAYADVRKAATDAVGEAPAASQAEEHVRKQAQPVLKRLHDQDPHAFAALLDRLEARYSTPMSIADAQGKLTQKMVEAAFEPAGFKADDELAKQAQKLSKEFGKKTVQTWVDARTNAFMASLLSDTAMPEVERAMFAAKRPTREMIAALRAPDTGTWQPSALASKEASAAKSVADFVSGGSGPGPGRIAAGYDDLFPQAGRAAAELGANLGGDIAKAAFAEARAVNFGLAARSFRVRGVIIGRPLMGKPLDVVDIRWTVTPAKAGGATRVAVDLRVADAKGATPVWRPAGVYDAAVLNQALRYAADRRVVATTIVAGDRETIRRQTSLHPALMDTPLGCRIVAADRLIDTFSFSPPLGALAQFSSDREAMSEWLQVARMTEIKSTDGNACSVKELQAIQKTSPQSVRFSPALRQSVDGFIAQHAGSDALLRRADKCATRPSRDIAACICEAPRASPLPARYWFPEDHTSQVRERPAALTPDLAWLRPSPGRLDALEFATHTTFALHDGQSGEGDDASATTLSFPPAELAVLRKEVIRRLPGYVANEMNTASYDDFARPVEEFVLAQRLARAALGGQLGRDFPLSKLVTLEKATRPFVPSQPTLRWEPAKPEQFLAGLAKKDPDAAKLYLAAEIDGQRRAMNRQPTCGPVSK